MTLGFNWQYLQEFLNNVGAVEMAGSEPSAGPASSEDSTGSAAAPAKETRSPIRISFEFKDPNAQTQMRIAGDTAYDYRYIVMPLRI